MQYLNIPKWMELLAELAIKDKWISGKDQKIMHPTIFYNIAPRLKNMGLLKMRKLKHDKRITEYALTIDGWVYGNIIRQLKNRVDEDG